MARTERDFKTLQQKALVRCGLYSFLSGIFSAEPRLELIQNFSRGGMLPQVSDVIGIGVDFGAFNQEVKVSNIGEVHRAVVSDFAILFGGDGRKPSVSSYETTYRAKATKISSTVWPEEACEVARAYQEAGLEVQPTYEGLPDHISMELEFMGFLCEREMGYWDQKDAGQAEEYIRFEQDFLKSHLGHWTGSFCRALEQHAKTHFYRAIARLLSAFLESERRGYVWNWNA